VVRVVKVDFELRSGKTRSGGFLSIIKNLFKLSPGDALRDDKLVKDVPSWTA